jgi:uncharacterized protein (DUF1330 family)
MVAGEEMKQCPYVQQGDGKIKGSGEGFSARRKFDWRSRPCFFMLADISPGSAVMPAYVIVDIQIQDSAGYDEYRKVVGASLARYGGKFLVRGGAIDVLEGNWNPERIVILEFDSAARARAWYDSEEYRLPKQLRMRASTANVIAVEGA